MTSDPIYQQKLDAEAAVWGKESEQMARRVPPDWRFIRTLRHNRVAHTTTIDQFLSRIQPGMTTLELGCASGWLTLATAQRGAHATGIDLSQKSLDIAQAYYQSIAQEVPGTVEYRAADLNSLELPAEHYDVIAVKGTLHHLVHLEHVVDQMYQALKPTGLVWIEDANGNESLPVVLIAGGLTLLLPTQVSYREKLRALLRFGLRAPSRVKASIEAEGLSPFEGAGREHDWLKLVRERFSIEYEQNSLAFTGYVTAQLKAPDWIALPILTIIRTVDRGLVRLHLVKSTGITIYARKKS